MAYERCTPMGSLSMGSTSTRDASMGWPPMRDTPMKWPCEKHVYERRVYERHAYGMAYGRCTPIKCPSIGGILYLEDTPKQYQSVQITFTIWDPQMAR